MTAPVQTGAAGFLARYDGAARRACPAIRGCALAAADAFRRAGLAGRSVRAGATRPGNTPACARSPTRRSSSR